MQAIILAAGMGRRLGRYTRDNTKCMVEVNGEKLIDRTMKQLERTGISKLVMVVGYQAKNLMDHIRGHYQGKMKVEFIENKIFDQTNNIYSLALAKEALCQEDTILLESDLIFEQEVLEKIIRDPYPNLALVDKYQTWMDGTMVCVNERKEIVNFIPKEAFRYENVDQYYKTVNIYKFSKEFSRDEYVPFLDAYCRVMGRNEYYEQVLRVLTLLQKSSLKALPLENEKWYEIDDIQDLDIASTLFSEKEKKYAEYHKRYGGFWRFPKLMDFCYLVNPYFPTTRMKEELKANMETLLTAYPSGMWVNSLLAGKYFGIRQEYVVVGNGAAELIKVVMEAHTEGKVGMIFPTFDEYPNRLPQDRIVPFVVKDEQYRYGIKELMDFYENHPIRMLLLINPDNPSGNLIPKQDLEKLAAWCGQKDITLLLDESFVDFAEGPAQAHSMLKDEILEAFPHLMVMKSISKSYGVPGLRLGILVSAQEKLIAKIKKEVSIWNINSFAEFYLQIFGKYEKDYELACQQFMIERERFKKELEKISFLRVFPSQANYFLCELTEKYSSKELTQRLIENNVIISNCELKKHMSGRQIIRLAIRDKKDNNLLINILKSLE